MYKLEKKNCLGWWKNTCPYLCLVFVALVWHWSLHALTMQGLHPTPGFCDCYSPSKPEFFVKFYASIWKVFGRNVVGSCTLAPWQPEGLKKDQVWHWKECFIHCQSRHKWHSEPPSSDKNIMRSVKALHSKEKPPSFPTLASLRHSEQKTSS